LIPRQATPVLFHWPFVKWLSPFLPALILIPFLLLKSNRRAGAWVMLVPFGVVAAVVLAGQLLQLRWLVRGFAMAYSYATMAGQLIPSLMAGGAGEPYLNLIMLASGLCVLCLMTYIIPTWSPLRKFPAVLALFVLPGVVTLYFLQAGDKNNKWSVPLAYAIVPLIMLTSLMLAGKWSRKRWSLVRFSILFLVCNSLLLFGLRLLYTVSFLIRQPLARPQWWSILMPRAASLWQGPTAIFAVVLPFIVTAFLSLFYRERLMAVFKVAPAPQPGQTAGSPP
jgi:hypothetical protein